LGRYVQTGGAGSIERRYFVFNAPASGTLKIKVSNTGSSEDMARLVAVNVNGVETTQAGGFAKTSPGELTFDVQVDAPTDVMVYSMVSGLCFWKLEYTYVASAAPQPVVWDFSSIFTDKVDPLVNTDEKSVYMLNPDGTKVDVTADGATATETFYLVGNGKKVKVNSYANTADGKTYNAINLGGGDAFLFINVDKPGLLTVVAAQAKSVADGSNCQLAVYVGGPHKDLAPYTAGAIVGERVELPGYDLAAAGNNAGTFEFEITDITAPTMVAITKPGGATSPDFYQVIWTPAN
jgi:hypothetical protein